MKLHNTKHRGLTLVELLVVLAILAVMTTLAVTMTDGLVDQGRYEATQRTLEAVRSAICGEANQRNEDGTPLTSGFVADMGRLPQNLTELYQTPPTNVTGFQSPTSDPTVQVFFPGWRGYMRLPVQTTPQIADGWGNPLTGYVYPVPQLTFTRSTPGSTNTYDNITFPTIPLPITGPVSASVKLNFPSTGSQTTVVAGDRIVVRLYSPMVSTTYVSSVTELNLVDPSNTANSYATVDLNSKDKSYLLSADNVTIGPKSARAYIYDSSLTTLKLSSQVVRFHLNSSGRLNLPTLYIDLPQTTTPTP